MGDPQVGKGDTTSTLYDVLCTKYVSPAGVSLGP